MRRGVVGLLGIAALSACSTYGDAPDVAPGDAGASAFDAGGTDASVDVASGPVASTGFCAGHQASLLCLDFDGRTSDGRFVAPGLTPYLTYTVAGGPGSTAGDKAFNFRLKDAINSLGVGEGAFRMSLQAAFTTARLSFRVLIEKADFEFARLAGFVLEGPETSSTFSADIFGRAGPSVDAFVLDGDDAMAVPTVTAKPLTWYSVIVELQRKDASFEGSVTIDGALVSMGSLPNKDGSQLVVAIGTFDTSKTPSSELGVWYDDILVETQ